MPSKSEALTRHPAHRADAQRLRAPQKDKLFRESLVRKLIAEVDNGKGLTQRRIDNIAEKLLKTAEGNGPDAFNAIREIANRCDGQAPRVLAPPDGDIPMFLHVQWLPQPPQQIEQVKVIDANGSDTDGSASGDGRPDDDDPGSNPED